MLGSEDRHSVAVMPATNDASECLYPNDNNEKTNTPKKKSMERISKLFQKKAKKQPTPSISSSMSSVSLSSSYQPQCNQTNATQQRTSNNTVGSSTVDRPHRTSSLRLQSRLSSLQAAQSRPSLDATTNGADEESEQSDAGSCATTVTLQAQLARQKQILQELEAENERYQHDNKILTDKLNKLREKKDQRQQDMLQLQSSYEEHIKALRATDDDLESICKRIRQLRENIGILAGMLVEKADAEVATRALGTFWLNLNETISEMGCPLSTPRLKMLTEKFMMDVLVQTLNLNAFPGVEVVEDYNRLQCWLEDQNACSRFPIRLRQEMALVVAKNDMDKDSSVYRSRHAALQNSWKYLYSGLVKAYPFVYQHDKAEPDIQKHYGAKVQILVDQTISLGLAIKGQEVDITAAAVAEGEQLFDPELMVDEDGQTSGIVQLCVCPPFVAGDFSTIKILEKGRVLCCPSEKLN